MNKSNHILVADDDPISLHAVTKILRSVGYAVTQASNGQETLALLRQMPDQYALVITDRIMPGLHAIELLKIMHGDTTLSKIPLIVLTGVADKEEMIEALQAGAFDFLYKPVEKPLLLAVVKKALQL